MNKRLILILLTVLTVTCFSQDSILFVIRVDDILSRNVTTLPRSIKDFQMAVEQRNGKVTWAVIPHRLIETQNHNGVVAQELRETLLNGHEISMHGYNHICPVCSQSSHEMFCTTNQQQIPYLQQLAIIDSGLQILLDTVGVVPKTFVPPAHVADTITFRALLDRGFDLLSSSGQTKKFIYKTLYNLAPNNEYTWQLTTAQYAPRLTAALNDIRNTATANGYYCLLLHDPFIRQGYENGLVIRWTGELLDSLNVFYGGRIRYVTLQEAFRHFNQPTDLAETERVPMGFSLSQNYPNPFNPVTTITFTIPGGAETRIGTSLRVYDMIGNEVAVLVNEEKGEGDYEVTFDAVGLSSGVYCYRLQAGRFTETRKLLLLK